MHSEWEGSAPQLKHAKARKYQDPVRCPGIAALWEALPEWERLGEEVKASGFDMPDWVRISALEKLVPTDLLGSLVGRPELDTYGKKVHWGTPGTRFKPEQSPAARRTPAATRS